MTSGGPSPLVQNAMRAPSAAVTCSVARVLDIASSVPVRGSGGTDEGVDGGGDLVGSFPVGAVAGVGVEPQLGSGDRGGDRGLLAGGEQRILFAAEDQGGCGDLAQTLGVG